MLNTIKIIPQAQQQTTLWSGGTTTQLFIYPENANYAKRDFLFRLSTATVKTETSTFTSLPGFNRVLMILNGKVIINHQNHYTKTLQPLDIDIFDGGWETNAVGTVVDFNVISKPSVKSEVIAKQIGRLKSETIQNKTSFSFGYLYSGSCMLKANDSTQYYLNTFDFVVFNTIDSYILTASTDCCWVVIHVFI